MYWNMTFANIYVYFWPSRRIVMGPGVYLEIAAVVWATHLYFKTKYFNPHNRSFSWRPLSHTGSGVASREYTMSTPLAHFLKPSYKTKTTICHLTRSSFRGNQVWYTGIVLYPYNIGSLCFSATPLFLWDDVLMQPVCCHPRLFLIGWFNRQSVYLSTCNVFTASFV